MPTTTTLAFLHGGSTFIFKYDQVITRRYMQQQFKHMQNAMRFQLSGEHKSELG